jgi:hypothetical protein
MLRVVCRIRIGNRFSINFLPTGYQLSISHMHTSMKGEHMPFARKISKKTTKGTKLFAIVAAGAALLSVAGCGQIQTADQVAGKSGADGASGSCPTSVNNDFTGTIRAGWQAIPNADLVVKDQKLLEACLPKAKVQWSQFQLRRGRAAGLRRQIAGHLAAGVEPVSEGGERAAQSAGASGMDPRCDW